MGVRMCTYLYRSFGEFSFIVSIKNVRATCQSSFSSRLQSKGRAKHRLRVEGTRRGTYVGPNRTIGRRGKRIKADIACTGLDKDRFPLDYEAGYTPMVVHAPKIDSERHEEGMNLP